MIHILPKAAPPKTPARHIVGAMVILLGATVAAPGAATSEQPPPTFVLSQNQIRSLKLLEDFAAVRIDWNRSTVGRPLAYSLRGEALNSFKKYLPAVPYAPDRKPERERLNAQGILICRLILRTLQNVWALFMRCELGNQLTVIIRREDLVMFDHEPTREEGRLIMDQQIQRLTRTYQEAKQRPDRFAN